MTISPAKNTYKELLLLFADEAHHSVTASWARIAKGFREAFVLGVTAPPERLDGCGVCDAFDEMVIGPGVADLVDLGLRGAPDRLYGRTARTFRFSIVNGDYDVAQIASIMSRSAIVGDAVELYAKLCPGRPALAYCRRHYKAYGPISSTAVGCGMR
jgi:DNA repair protein RadD